jgi:hypothetical protein
MCTVYAMAVSKFLGKIFLLKNVGILNMEEYRFRISVSARTYMENVIPKFENLFGNKLKPIKAPIRKWYHPEVYATTAIGSCCYLLSYQSFFANIYTCSCTLVLVD